MALGVVCSVFVRVLIGSCSRGSEVSSGGRPGLLAIVAGLIRARRCDPGRDWLHSQWRLGAQHGQPSSGPHAGTAYISRRRAAVRV